MEKNKVENLSKISGGGKIDYDGNGNLKITWKPGEDINILATIAVTLVTEQDVSNLLPRLSQENNKPLINNEEHSLTFRANPQTILKYSQRQKR